MKTIEISPDELKDYTESFKACAFQNDGLKFESKFGRVLFDLSGIDATKCDFYFKRVSGDGKVIIKSITTETKIVASKISQVFSVDIDKNIEIRRDDCVGEIVLTGIIAYCADDNMASNWREILKRCGRYKCLRSFKGKLFASAGGYIEDKYAIQDIQTDPGGMFRREGNRIVFAESCEITKIRLGDSGAQITVERPYTHRNKPTPHITMATEVQPEDVMKSADTTTRPWSLCPENEEAAQAELNKNIIFSSTALNAFSKFGHVQNKSAKLIRSNGKEYLLVRRGGHCSLSISDLLNDTEYIVVIKAKRLNGNGRVAFALSAKDNDLSNFKEVVFAGNSTNKYIQIRTGDCKYGQFHKLNIAMGDSASGEVLIEEILIIKNIGIKRTKGIIEHEYDFSRREDSPKSLLLGSVVSADDNDIDSIYQLSKVYARHIPMQGDCKVVNSVIGSAATSTTSGMGWLNKVSHVFPKVRLIKDLSSVEDNTILISRMGALKPAKRIWVDAFVDMSAKDREILSKAKHIYSPSLRNVQVLESKFTNAKVERCMRLLPYVAPCKVHYFSNKDFVLCFHRGYGSTNRIIESWKDEYPKLALVGARGKFPDKVIPVNEYMPYDELLYLMDKCRFVIDVPAYRDYDSSLLMMAHYMGIPIISSNWFAIDKSNCIFVPSVERAGSYAIPTIWGIRSAIKQLLDSERRHSRIDEYKEKFLAESSRLFVA